MNFDHHIGRRVCIAGALTLGAMAAPAGATPTPRPSASVANDILTVVGTRGGDSITISAVDPAGLVVDFGNGTDPQRFDRNRFSAISVFLQAGDDQLTVGNGLADEALTVHAGAGNDTVTGGDGNDVIFGGRGDDTIDGGRGNDTEILGGGDDTAGWFPGENNDLVIGGAGHDALRFNGSNAPEHISVSANGTQAVLSRDVANIRMDLDGVEDVDVAALGGADVLTVGDLSGTDVRYAAADLSLQGAGDGAADSVVVNGTNSADRIAVVADGSAVRATGLPATTVVTGSEPTDRLQVNSGGGNDRVRVDPSATALIAVSVDLGTGQR